MEISFSWRKNTTCTLLQSYSLLPFFSVIAWPNSGQFVFLIERSNHQMLSRIKLHPSLIYHPRDRNWQAWQQEGWIKSGDCFCTLLQCFTDEDAGNAIITVISFNICSGWEERHWGLVCNEIVMLKSVLVHKVFQTWYLIGRLCIRQPVKSNFRTSLLTDMDFTWILFNNPGLWWFPLANIDIAE